MPSIFTLPTTLPSSQFSRNFFRMAETNPEESELTIEEEFEVEKILNERTYRGKTQYLIRWRGYEA